MIPFKYYGIDLGTTHTVVYRREDLGLDNCLELPRSLKESDGGEEVYLLPSVVQFKENGDVIVGTAAREAVKTDPGHVYFNSKIGLGGNSNREHTAVECAAEILKVCFSAIYQRDGEKNVRICISVPAAFSQDKKKEIEEAARKASDEKKMFQKLFQKEVKTTEEPYAAILNIIKCEKDFPLDIKDKDTYVMLIDIGGGTMDIITCGFHYDEKEGKIQVNFRGKTPGNADEFAGANFDQKLKEQFMQDFLDHYHLQQANIPDEILCKLENLFQIFGEDAKKHLCKGTPEPYEFSPEIRIGGLPLSDEYGLFKLKMTKKQMDKLLKPLIKNDGGLESIDSCIHKHLSNNQMFMNQIDFVYLTGGMSKYDKIVDHIKTMTKKPVFCASHPLICTAQGIAAAQRIEIDDDNYLTSLPSPQSRAESSPEPENAAERELPAEPSVQENPAAAIPVVVEPPDQIGVSFFIDVEGSLPVEIIPKTQQYPCDLTLADVQLCTTSQSRVNLLIFEGDNKYDPDLKLLRKKTIDFSDAIETGTPVKLAYKIDSNKIITFYGSIDGAPPIEFECFAENIQIQ